MTGCNQKKSSGFEKRLKRRIIGPEHSFFAICPPGLEPLLKTEIQASGISTKPLTIEKGGITFTAKLADVMQLNLSSGCASRILMRIARFHCDSFSKLEKELQKIEWPLYLQNATAIDFQISAYKSRLYHSGAIEERFRKAVSSQIDLQPQDLPIPPDLFVQTIFVRVSRDKFLVSLDTSGTLLSKRGIKTRVTPAPIRENLAFALLNWAKLSPDDILMDPMCGSGTFALEGALIKSGIAPGLFRRFAFENWPAFRAKAFQHMKKKAWEKFIPPQKPEIFASDLNSDSIETAKFNCHGHEFSNLIRFETADFFSLKPSKTGKSRKGVIALNPPYGKRLDTASTQEQFFYDIGRKLKTDFKGWRAGIVIPDTSLAGVLDLNLKMRPVFHGGLEIFIGISVI